MNLTHRIPAALAVVAIFLMGCSPLSPDSPSASPSPSQKSPPPPSPAAVEFPPAGPLAIGRHHMIREGVPLSIGLQTTGWRSNGDFYMDTLETDSPNFIFWGVTPDGVYADPCNQVKAEAVGPSAAALADAVALLPGIELVSGPTDVVVGGNPGKQVVLKVPEDIGCPAGGFYLWYDEETGGRWASFLNATIRVWIIEVEGATLWIDAETDEDAGPEVDQEIQEIIDSIVFE
jgi:hypothetical protein